ncbi:MAG: bifunctional 3-(3-hydroxy-phenyl)propionate/3-hydroxycinnamic acid hydroxylase [Micrococcaceae bacterium]|nr:bifunctional 3-(3-hydroxy-phenyl)propionate/3-hydroxycinnamic acid hydroxylase [Micrococcaceae bacterium]
MSQEFDADVIVVGGGPVGVGALALLGRLGLTAIGFEKETELWPTARAVHFDGEVMRVLQSLGIADELAKVTKPMTAMHMQNEAREKLVSVPTGQLGSQGWHDDVTFHQPDVERLLRGVVDESAGVELRCGVEVMHFENLDEGVRVTVRETDGSQGVYTARWLVGADGAKSFVRRSLDIGADKFGEDARWVVVDGHLHDSPGYEDDMIFLLHHTRPAMWIRLPGTRVRMEFLVMDEDDPEEIITPEAIERISHGVLPASQFEPERQAIYMFRGRIAKSWREGNVFLAGDAAHLAPPCFGQGLCAGLRDIANLAWKLDLVKRGQAKDSILDTYESERKPHAQFWVEQAVTAAGFLQTTNSEEAAHRDANIRANPMAAAPVSPPLGAGLHRGALDEQAGRLSVQSILTDDVRLDDMLGVRFVIAAQREVYEQLDQALRGRIEDSRDIVVLLDTAKNAQLLQASNASAVVVRPDRYIFGTASDSVELQDLIELLPLANIRHESACVYT